MKASPLSLLFVLALTALLAGLACGDIAVQLKIDDTKVGGEIEAEYGSFNFDWWPNESDQAGWFEAGLLNIDLSPRLRFLARQLAPAHLRIGGTLADTIVYEIPGKTHNACVVGSNCLNMTRWEQVVSFAREAKVTLAFGLSERYGNGTPGTWDPSNTRDFLEYIITNKQEDVIFGFELGNELDLAKYSGAACARDFHTLHGILVDLWPNAASRPKLIGPDCVPNITWATDFLAGAGSVVDVITWHLYIGAGFDPKLPADMTDPKFLNRSRVMGEPWPVLRDKYAPNAQLWVGETAAAYHSGLNHTTNAFVDGFWYLNQLGALALLGHSAQCRQTLVGGNYGLLQNVNFTPNPDFWTLLLFKRNVGRRALHIIGGDEHLSAYAYCSRTHKGGLVLTLGNLAQTEAYKVTVGIRDIVPRVEYHMSAPMLNSSVVYLNNRPLVLTSKDTLPDLSGKWITDDKSVLTLAPHTYSIIEFPNAKLSLCN